MKAFTDGLRRVIRFQSQCVRIGDMCFAQILLGWKIPLALTETSYTCAHRTIQEYFAAREAIRSRETSKVVISFGERPDLVEVLYFYCALLRNLPALASILSSLNTDGKWLESGRCLLFMKEVPSSDFVATAASHLHQAITDNLNAGVAIEVLSSLANRRAPEFEAARKLFTDAIEYLSRSNDSEASALESAIAASPEIAIKVIPGLIKHRSERWRAAGVQLLRDIGTDESIDQLVQLLNNRDAYVRTRAAMVLAGMIKTNNRALRQRAPLLPPRRDRAIWPLEPYFPGTVAIPIAESLVSEETSDSDAINCAIHAIKLGQNQPADAIFKKWQRVPLDVRLDYYRRRSARLVGLIGFMLLVITLAGVFATKTIGAFLNHGFLISTAHPYVATVDTRFVDKVSRVANSIDEELKLKYPGPSGLARLW